MTVKEKLNSVIKKTKKSLLAKAKKKGLYENFGDKESRKLDDLVHSFRLPSYEERELKDMVLEFDRWARNVNDREVRES